MRTTASSSTALGARAQACRAIVMAMAACLGAMPACYAAESSAEPGVVQKVEHAVEHGAKAAASGVERGVKAAASGVGRGEIGRAHV